MLHHTVVAAIPLSVIYFLFLLSRWRPHQLTMVPSPSPVVLLATAIGLFMVIAVGTTLIGLQPATLLVIAALIIGLVFVLSRRMAGRQPAGADGSPSSKPMSKRGQPTTTESRPYTRKSGTTSTATIGSR